MRVPPYQGSSSDIQAKLGEYNLAGLHPMNGLSTSKYEIDGHSRDRIGEYIGLQSAGGNHMHPNYQEVKEGGPSHMI